MGKKPVIICDTCKINMEELEVQFSYLSRSFRHKVNRCPQCGQVCLSEDIVTGRMKEVEELMEEK